MANPSTSRLPREIAPRSLPATAWAVLGLLSFGRDLTGYDLKKWADSSLRFFYWSPAISQIYGELRRLESLGYVETPMLASAVAEPATRAQLESHVPLGRLARPADVAAVVRCLLSDESRYVHGAAVVVDGGVTATGGQ